jgi:hypothetical protein
MLGTFERIEIIQPTRKLAGWNNTNEGESDLEAMCKPEISVKLSVVHRPVAIAQCKK